MAEPAPRQHRNDEKLTRRLGPLHWRVMPPGRVAAPSIRKAASAMPPDLRLSYFALYATTSPAVIWGGFGYNDARLFCRTQSAALLLDSCALA